jgi:FKBP-type peptidyl-prolyl cis-trans isomerase FkpA
MRKAAFWVLFIILSINSAAQSSPDTTVYLKAGDGSDYKIFHLKKGAPVAAGNFMELNIIATYKDSVLFNTYDDGMPQFGLYDTANFPAPFKDVFREISVGDSVVLRIPTDSILAKTPGADFMEKGHYLYQRYYVTNVYSSKEQVDSVQKIYTPLARAKANKKQQEQIQQFLRDNKEQITKDSKIIEAYLAKNNIKAFKTDWGTYVAVKKEGIGKNVSATDVATVNYTGKVLGGTKVFDSNTDPAFKHVQPYDVNMNQVENVMLGWPDALLQMKKGTRAMVYIPSSLGYGKEGRMPEIKPDEILTFDMEVMDISTEAEMVSKQEAIMKAAEEAAKKPVKKAPVKAQPKKGKPVSKPKTPIKKTGK